MIETIRGTIIYIFLFATKIALINLFALPLTGAINIFLAYKTKWTWLLPAFYASVLFLHMLNEMIGKSWTIETFKLVFSQELGIFVWIIYPAVITFTMAYTAYGRFVRKTADEEKQKRSALEENN